jgi:hypothetical protein
MVERRAWPDCSTKPDARAALALHDGGIDLAPAPE